MSTLKFKTNINCGGCIKSVSPFLNHESIQNWEVDTENPDKILSVETNTLDANQVIEMVSKAGFEISVQ